MSKKACLYIKNKCLENGINNPTQFTHKNSVTVTVTPCTADPESQSWDDVEYFMTDCDRVYLPGYFELEKVANILLNLDDVIAKNDEQKEFLARRIKSIEAMPDGDDKEYELQLYSDMYKSCYGYRPKREPIDLEKVNPDPFEV